MGRWARKPVNHTSWVAVVTPTDRPKSVRNRCLIELFCGVVCVVTLPFWHFCWCRGFCHRTESDLFLFLLMWAYYQYDVLFSWFIPMLPNYWPLQIAKKPNLSVATCRAKYIHFINLKLLYLFREVWSVNRVTTPVLWPLSPKVTALKLVRNHLFYRFTMQTFSSIACFSLYSYYMGLMLCLISLALVQ